MERWGRGFKLRCCLWKYDNEKSCDEGPVEPLALLKARECWDELLRDYDVRRVEAFPW